MYFARLKPGAARFFIGALFVGATIPALAQTVIMGVHPLFDGLQPGTGVVPMEVDLANTGADARGVVRVSVGDYAMTYPVELPQGTKKRMVTYPDCGQYAMGALQFDLVTNRGRLHQTVEASGAAPSAQFVVGEIAENGGDLGFLRSQNRDYSKDYSMMAPQDVYVKPSDAPDRSAGYQRLSALVLGAGAERLSDDSVNAIKTWTLSGGTLIFIGGASSPILNDVRWNSALPVSGATQKNFDGSKALAQRYGSSPGPFTAMVGKTMPNASARVGGLITERPFGLGRAVYLAFNPFENPMIGWGSRGKMFGEIVSPALANSSQMVISTVVNTQAINPSGSRYGSMYNPYGSQNAGANNPFRATLPDTSKVLWILGAYFIAVVPLNFFVLRRLKRGELAWGTAPLLSLGFAGVFFMAAQGLYAAQLSTSAKGLVIVQQGDPDALILGYSQMYFPRGGRYDLKLNNVDSLIQTSPDDPYSRQNHSVYDDMDAADTGQVQASVSVPNLAFREVTYREHIQANQWFDVHRLANGHFSVTNNSNYVLTNARMVGGGGWQLLGDLKPQETREVSFAQPTLSSDDLPARLSQFLVRSNGLALTGRLTGLRAGPQLGDEVKDSAGLTLAFVTNERLKSNEMIRPNQQGL
jgi:hypothetical protein